MKNENLQAGKLEIEELSLVNYNGEVLDLQTFIYGFDVYEDIMSQTMSATLYMNDGNALIERLPIIGDERVYMKFKSPLQEEFFENWFGICNSFNFINPFKLLSEEKLFFSILISCCFFANLPTYPTIPSSKILFAFWISIYLYIINFKLNLY